MNTISKSYYIKDERGKLVLVSEQSVVSLIKNKTIKPNSKLFCKTFNKWVKASELSLYKNVSKLINTSQKEENFELIEKASESDPSYQIASLLDKVEDAKTFIFKSKLEHLAVYKKFEEQKTQLETKVHEASLTLKALHKENKVLKTQLENLEQRHIEDLKVALTQDSDQNKIKLEAQITKLKKQIKITTLNYKGELEATNKLLIQVEQQKREFIELYEIKEQLESQNAIFLREQKHYADNLSAFDNEITHVHNQKLLVQNELDNLLEKHRELVKDFHLEQENNRKSQENIFSLETESEAHKNEIETLKEVNSKLEQKIIGLTAEYQEHLVRSKESQLNIEEERLFSQSEMNELKAENESLLRQLEQTKKDLENKTNSFDALQSLPPLPISEDQEVKEKEIQQKLEEALKEVNLSKKTLKQKDSKIEDYKKQIQSLKSKSNTSEKENSYAKQNELLKKRIVEEEKKSALLLQKAKDIATKFQQKQKELTLVKEENQKLKKNEIKASASDSSPIEWQDELVQENDNAIEVDNLLTLTINEQKPDESIPEETKLEPKLRIIDQVNDSLLVEPTTPGNNQSQDSKLNNQEDEGTIELCEIENGLVWSIKGVPKLDGQYNIEQVRKFREKDEISDSTFVKKDGEWWKRYNQYYELLIPITPITTGEITKFFIKKQLLRVPVNESANVKTTESEVNLQIVNVSLNGCQAKVSESMGSFLKEGMLIDINFNVDSVLKGSKASGIIRRVETEGSMLSFGIQFLELSELAKESIQLLLTDFTSKITKTAA